MIQSPAALLVGLIPLSATLLLGQNPRSVLSAHPRLMINNTIADTWQPSLSRLAAVAQRALPGGVANADFNTLTAGITSPNPLFGNSSNEDANLNLLLNYAFAYQVYHQAHQDSLANPYAAAAWNGLTALNGPVYSITSIVTDGNGLATATLSAPANPPIQTGYYALAVWGVSNDALNGALYVSSVPSPTTFTYSTSVPNATFSGPGIYGSASWFGASSQGESARQLSQWAYFYDWCYDWLVSNGHDQYARDQIKTGYWSNTMTRTSTQWSDNVRETDFHNYTSVFETAVLDAGLALFGDDPLGATILDEGAGYLWEGITVQPADCCQDKYEYNLKKSVDTLTGGAMNWEGPTYWRAGTIRFLRAIEAYDSATGRHNNTWTTQFPNARNAGMYKIYVRDPSGLMANFGDTGNSAGFAGRDNFGMAILNDRFPDPHFLWMMTNSPNDWNSGDSGQTGLVYKLIYFPYVNGPAAHDPSDLPPGAQFGTDVIMRSGWGPSDTFITYSGSLKGTYHRHDDAGTFTIYNTAPLVLGQPYTLYGGVYGDYNRRTVGANTLTIFDPTDCWKDNAPTCGVDAYGDLLVNDGGQLPTLRRYSNQFADNQYDISRIWSGSLYSDGRYSNLYQVIDAPNLPVFQLGAGYQHVTQDLSSAYVNSFSGAGDNPHAKVTPGGVTRELVYFQPSNGSSGDLVVFDQVTATNPSFKKSWLLHTVNPPAVNGVRTRPGDTTYPGATLSQADNGSGRLFVGHVLPAKTNLRTVGGNACAPIAILGATNANPAVFYAPGHGLQVGENLGLTTGAQPDTIFGPQWWPNWLLDRYFAYHSVDSVPDPDHFTISYGYGSDSTGFAPWTTAFTSGAGAPQSSGAFAGQIYYQTDAAKGNTVWQWNGSAWVNLADAGLAPAAGYTSPVVYTHSNCNWSYYVDQLGPQGSPGAHLWNESMDNASPNVRPDWLLAASPSSNNPTDYFLNVLTPATTAVTTAPVTTLIQSGSPAITAGPGAPLAPQAATPHPGSVYGVQIADGGAVYVAVFSAAHGRVSTLAYSAPHGGMAQHVAASLAPGTYLVRQNGEVLGVYVALEDGSISFHESGGGSFAISPFDPVTSLSGPDGPFLR